MVKITFFLFLSFLALSHSLKLANFSLNFFKFIAQSEPEGNFVISPASFGFATGLVLLGAGGETRSQIESALGDSRQLLELSKQINADKSLESANKIFLADQFSLRETYQQNVRNVFHIEGAERVNFTAATETAAKINNWVAERTHGLIKDMVKADELDLDTVAMLLNALYFKAEWEYRFILIQLDRFKLKFWTSKNEKIDLNFITIEDNFKYAAIEEEKVRLLELPYKDTNVKMVILLPMEKDGLRKLEENLSGEKLMEMLGKMKSDQDEKFSVRMPRFKIETEKGLEEVAEKLGMRRIFRDDAELENLGDPKGIHIKKILQKTLIEVNENGTVAASSTSYQAVDRISGATEFFVDRPFLFLLKNEDFIFFMGRVVKPEFEERANNRN